ncbi:WbqC family protein [Paracoccaceae bacterium]|nr:WbqC family protein [Paracoccaceae bacterium]
MITRLAAMQPTFIPWMGYFAMIEISEHFVFLDDVQLNRRSWQIRNRMRVGNENLMLTLSVNGKPSRALIMDVKLVSNGFENKLFRSLEYALCKREFGDLAYSIVMKAFKQCKGSLRDLNVAIIKSVCSYAGISTNFYFSSELPRMSGDKAERHLKLTEFFGVDAYLSPIGSIDYFKSYNPFQKSKKNLEFLNYEHPVYDQGVQEFTSHMSALEAFAIIGPEHFRAIVKSGLRSSKTIKELMETK